MKTIDTKTYEFYPEKMPDEMKSFPHWVVWRYDWNEKRQANVKVPYFRSVTGKLKMARSNDPSTWMTFEEAVTTARERQIGLGFMFGNAQASNPFMMVDIDKNADPEVVKNLIRDLETYTEVSPSGLGVHLLLKGQVPGERKRRDPYETYHELRFTTMTGRKVENTPNHINELNNAYDTFYTDYILKGETKKPAHTDTTPQKSQSLPLQAGNHTTNISSIHDVLNCARNDGRYGERFLELYETGRRSNDPEPNFSDQDYYFMILAARYTGDNPHLLDSIYRSSALYSLAHRQDKWDKPARNGETYGNGTINRAISAASKERYKPKRSS